MTLKKRRLGKGLDSLIGPADDSAAANGGTRELPLSQIELNPHQPRTIMDETALEELAASIKSAGVLQPVVVRPAGGGGYELVMGERRLRAARRAGLQTVPALVRKVDDDRMLELALIENVQRQDLGAIEKARALERMCSELNMTQEEAARRIGLGRPTVANFIRLLELPEEVQEMVSSGTLSGGHARAILSAPPQVRVRLAHHVVEADMSVRETEAMAARAAAGESDDEEAPGRTAAGSGPPPHVQRLQAILAEALGADVRIKTRGKKGTIVLHFSDHEQFEALFATLTGIDDMPV